jgi:truncated hemoglobin YjbI
MKIIQNKNNEQLSIKTLVVKLMKRIFDDPLLLPSFGFEISSPTGLIDFHENLKNYLMFIINKHNFSQEKLEGKIATSFVQEMTKEHLEKFIIHLEHCMKEVDVHDDIQKEILENARSSLLASITTIEKLN